jgi:hypothetical protein
MKKMIVAPVAMLFSVMGRAICQKTRIRDAPSATLASSTSRGTARKNGRMIGMQKGSSSAVSAQDDAQLRADEVPACQHSVGGISQAGCGVI